MKHGMYYTLFSSLCQGKEKLEHIRITGQNTVNHGKQQQNDRQDKRNEENLYLKGF